MRPFALTVALALAAPADAAALLSLAALQADVEAFAGRPSRVDPRLMLPACTQISLSWAPGGRSVVVACDAPQWRVFVPVANATTLPLTEAAPAIRRGERVTVEAGGEGFVIGMEAVAESDSREGRVALRPVTGGRRLQGIIGVDGRVRIHGLNAMVNGR